MRQHRRVVVSGQGRFWIDRTHERNIPALPWRWRKSHIGTYGLLQRSEHDGTDGGEWRDIRRIGSLGTDQGWWNEYESDQHALDHPLRNADAMRRILLLLFAISIVPLSVAGDIIKRGPAGTGGGGGGSDGLGATGNKGLFTVSGASPTILAAFSDPVTSEIFHFDGSGSFIPTPSGYSAGLGVPVQLYSRNQSVPPTATGEVSGADITFQNEAGGINQSGSKSTGSVAIMHGVMNTPGQYYGLHVNGIKSGHGDAIGYFGNLICDNLIRDAGDEGCMGIRQQVADYGQTPILTVTFPTSVAPYVASPTGMSLSNSDYIGVGNLIVWTQGGSAISLTGYVPGTRTWTYTGSAGTLLGRCMKVDSQDYLDTQSVTVGAWLYIDSEPTPGSTFTTQLYGPSGAATGAPNHYAGLTLPTNGTVAKACNRVAAVTRNTFSNGTITISGADLTNQATWAASAPVGNCAANCAVVIVADPVPNMSGLKLLASNRKGFTDPTNAGLITLIPRGSSGDQVFPNGVLIEGQAGNASATDGFHCERSVDNAGSCVHHESRQNNGANETAIRQTIVFNDGTSGQGWLAKFFKNTGGTGEVTGLRIGFDATGALHRLFFGPDKTTGRDFVTAPAPGVSGLNGDLLIYDGSGDRNNGWTFSHRLNTYNSANDPQNGVNNCAQNEFWLNTTLNTLWYCQTTNNWAFIAGPLTAPDVSTAYHAFHTWTLPNLDNDPGVSVGAGKDANPSPGNQVGTVTTGIFTNPDTNNLDPAYTTGSFNFGNANPDLPYQGGGWTTEYNWNATARSETNIQVEQYQQFNPNMFLVTFGAGTGVVTAGQNWTFTNGAVCRPAGAGTSATIGFGQALNSGKLRLFCLGSVPPVNGNAITACTGPTCTNIVGTTVSAVPVQDGSFRPFFMSYEPGLNQAYLYAMRSGSLGGGSSVPAYFFYGGIDGVFRLGESSTGDPPTQITIPARTTMGLCTVGPGCTGTPLVQSSGGIGIDLTHAGVVNSTPDYGGQIRYGTTPFMAESISPTKTACETLNNVTSASVNVNLAFAPWEPSTVVAVGCRDNNNASPVTPTTMTSATNAAVSIPLAATLSCSGSGAAMAYQPTSTTWQDQTTAANLVSGGGLQVSFVPGSVPSSSYSVCVAYRDTGL